MLSSELGSPLPLCGLFCQASKPPLPLSPTTPFLLPLPDSRHFLPAPLAGCFHLAWQGPTDLTLSWGQAYSAGLGLPEHSACPQSGNLPWNTLQPTCTCHFSQTAKQAATATRLSAAAAIQLTLGGQWTMGTAAHQPH